MLKKRRESKRKGERERHLHLNADFQPTGRRAEKAFSNEQCIRLQEINRSRKTRDVFRKIGKSREHFTQRRAQ